MNPPTTSIVDQSYFKSPTESLDAYNARISTYNTNKNAGMAPGGTAYNPTEDPKNYPGGAQPGADVTKQGQPGYDVFGNPVVKPTTTTTSSSATTPKIPAGMTQQDYNDFKSTNPDIEPTDRDVKQMQLAEAQNDLQTHATNAMTAIDNIQNGATPLSPGQTAQVDGLKQQFQQLIDQQTQTNAGATGTAQIRGFQTGSAEYDPTFQVKHIASIITAGQAKISDLQIKEASAVADLTESFKSKNIQDIKDSYDIYVAASKARTDAIQKYIDDTTTALKNAADDKAKQQQYELDVEKFNQTKDQDAFDNALKAEQEKFDEQNKTDTLALDKFKAGEGAGGGGVGVSNSAQMAPDGTVDLASQKQVLDQITAKYGPMTAIAIKGLADYSMNPGDWKAGAAKGMSRDQAVTLAKMVDPTYNDANYAIRAAYMKSVASTQTGTVGNSINAANKSINHLTSFVNTMSKLNGDAASKLPGATSFGNAIANAITLDPARRQNLAAAKTEGLGVAEELAKFFKGSGTVDVASIDAWKSQLSTNATPSDVKGLTQGAITLLAGQLETLSEQYESTMGHRPPGNFLNESATANLSQLKNEGYDVNIPGVLYTDKDAYIKNDPDAQSNIDAAITSLSEHGFPLTDENILQAAQSI